MKALLSKRAARVAERIDARWREHANDPGVFAREFLEAIELLETTAGVGTPFPTAKHPALKRLLPQKSKCHLYFGVDGASQNPTRYVFVSREFARSRPPAPGVRLAA